MLHCCSKIVFIFNAVPLQLQLFVAGICFPGDRRATKGSGYNYEASGGSYGRGYAAAEPEWYTEGPVSQSDTIELHGFDGAHGERLQTQNTSDDGDNSRLEDQRVRAARRSKDDRAGRSGTVKDKDSSSNRSQNETCDTMPNTVLDEKNERREWYTPFCLSTVFSCNIFRAKLYS